MPNFCIDCKKQITSYRKRCRLCYRKFIKISDNHPRWKKERRKCMDCNKVFLNLTNKPLRCRFCYLEFNKGSNNPAWKGGLPNCENCNKKLTRRGFKRCPSCNKLRERNGSWKGGKIIQHNGYIMIYKPEHPFATKNGYIMEQRLNAEKILGHYLRPKEVMHHINGDKINNHPENLYLCKNKSEHVKIHRHNLIVISNLTSQQ